MTYVKISSRHVSCRKCQFQNQDAIDLIAAYFECTWNATIAARVMLCPLAVISGTWKQFPTKITTNTNVKWQIPNTDTELTLNDWGKHLIPSVRILYDFFFSDSEGVSRSRANTSETLTNRPWLILTCLYLGIRNDEGGRKTEENFNFRAIPLQKLQNNPRIKRSMAVHSPRRHAAPSSQLTRSFDWNGAIPNIFPGIKEKWDPKYPHYGSWLYRRSVVFRWTGGGGRVLIRASICESATMAGRREKKTTARGKRKWHR